MASKMGRKCVVVSCKSTNGIHRFPEDLEIKRLWVHALCLGDGDSLPPSSGVCNRHFSRDAFSNYTEFEMGFTKQLHLKSNAVPIFQQQKQQQQQQQQKQQQQQHHHQGTRLLLPKLKREFGCQTDPVLTKYASVQADLKPPKRSKAIQARAPSRSVSCYTDTFTVPSVPKNTTSSVKTARRQRGGESAGDSSSHLDGNKPTAQLMSSFSEVAPWVQDKTDYVVEEEQLLELFGTCPVCKQSCVVENTTTGTLVHVSQQCNHCEFTNKWCSQPLVNNPEGDVQLSAAVLFSGSTVPQTSDEQQT